MKTLRQLFDILQVRIRRTAVSNTVNKINGGLGDLDTLAPNLHTALHMAFIWSKTPEGFEYWDAIARKYQRLEQELEEASN